MAPETGRSTKSLTPPPRRLTRTSPASRFGVMPGWVRAHDDSHGIVRLFCDSRVTQWFGRVLVRPNGVCIRLSTGTKQSTLTRRDSFTCSCAARASCSSSSVNRRE